MLSFYDEKKAQWDLWKRDYCQYDYYSGIVQFETGETICDAVHFRPERRKTYGDLGISILDHTDDKFPSVFTEDGERVKSSWFGDVQRTFVVDDATSRVVEIASFQYMKPRAHSDLLKQKHWCAENNVPLWFWGECSVYWPGPGCPPVGSPIKLTKPRKPTAEEREYVALFRAGMRAELAMREIKEYPTPEVLIKWKFGYKPQYRGPVKLGDLMQIKWENADLMLKYKIQEWGIEYPTETSFVPYLIARRPVEEDGDVDPNRLQ